jgi:hypothetical protein
MTDDMICWPIPNWALPHLLAAEDRMEDIRMARFLATDEGKAIMARAEAAYAEDARRSS